MHTTQLPFLLYLALGAYFLAIGLYGRLSKHPRVSRSPQFTVLLLTLAAPLLGRLIDPITLEPQFSVLLLILLFVPLFASSYFLSQTYKVAGMTEQQVRDALLSTLQSLEIQTEITGHDIHLPSYEAQLSITPHPIQGDVLVHLDRRDSHTLLNRIMREFAHSFRAANNFASRTAFVGDLLTGSILMVGAGVFLGMFPT